MDHGPRRCGGRSVKSFDGDLSGGILPGAGSRYHQAGDGSARRDLAGRLRGLGHARHRASLVRDHLMPFFSGRFSFFPFVSDNYTGFSALAGGLVLAVMVTPFMISLMEEVMRSIPFGVRESSLALGATSWQTTKKVILKKRAGDCGGGDPRPFPRHRRNDGGLDGSRLRVAGVPKIDL